ncbi:CGNR zinc finger domain-containing protein (plasmid) [Rhizobium sp. 32-5/1]|uniref:CGNR zinc finger domain-containing protein n=1 Tax=Rhizobium sp. 32-5/1 TaxID=3019602 RepID=UPI00240D1EF0|nr:CGNR zinc finger domain-containing protein [Rhizobium sp. 32-5/1]WEZ85541.1 CGNR zinc finger domain-containing protein [Rhizobium sp. 32-5/1]
MKDALQLREAVYAVFLSEDTERLYPHDAFQCVHKVAKQARARQVLSETDAGYRWLPLLTEPADLAGLFAEAAAELIMRRYDRRLIRECKGDNCGWLFLDTSKSGRRIWCSEATCGTHERVKRFRKSESKRLAGLTVEHNAAQLEKCIRGALNSCEPTTC